MRKLVLFAAGFTMAAALYVYLICDARILWLGGICLLLSPICLFLGLRRCSAVFLGVLFGVIWCFGYSQVRLGPAERAYGTEQIVEAEVLSRPVATRYGSSAKVEIILEGRHYQAILYGEDDLLAASPGDTVGCNVQVGPALSDEKDRYFYHQADGTMLLLQAKSDLEIEPGEPKWYVALQLWFQSRIYVLYDEESAPLLSALLTGDQSGLSFALRNELAITGLSHAVAVSGLHVAVLVSALALLFGYNPRLTALFGIPLSVAFVLMTGASASACRSAVMQIVMLTAPMVRRENDSWTDLALAACLLLMENPWAITGVGFQLSFAAVAGLLVFSSPLQKRLLALRKKPGRIWRAMVSGISACLSATVATLPLVVYYFGVVSLSAVITNLLVLPAMNVMLVLGLGTCLLGSLGAVLAIPVALLTKYVLFVVEHAAKFPFAAAFSQNLPLMLWAVCAYGLLVFLILRKRKTSLWVPVIMTGAFLSCILWGSWNFGHDAPVYRVLDVGQGQCIILETGELTAVIDCGGSSPEKVGEQAARTLNSAGKTHVEILALTHYDTDHAGGAAQFLRRIRTDLVLLPNVADGSGLRQEIEAAAWETGAQVLLITELVKVNFSGGSFTVYPALSPENEKNAGICILATVEEYDMLITGDLNQQAELRLLSRYRLPQVEVLVAGHHGAKNSTGLTLLKTVQPKLVIVSADKDNPYGHPAKETLDRVKLVGAEVIMTGQAGDIAIRRR